MKNSGKRVALVLSVVALGLVGCGGDKVDKESPKTITVKGTMTLTDSDVESVAGRCYGTGGYDDMRSGTQVTVRDSDGKSIGLGSLDEGEPDERFPTVTCHFGFTVTDVPAGIGIYSVEVSHRGEISFKETDASDISLSLG